MSVSAVTRRVSAPSVDSRSGTAGQMPTDALLLPPLRDAPSTLSQPGSPHSFHENRPPDAPRLLPDALPRGCCWTPPWLWHPARFTPQLPRKPSAGCASTVAGSASPWLLLDPALALAPSQVHPTASTKTVRRMRLDRCRMRFPVVVAGPHRPGSGTQPGSPHSFHENRPPDAPRLLLDPLPRGCLLDPALALAPSQVHPTASTKTVRRMRLDRCCIRFPVVVCWTTALALAPSQVHPTASTKTVRRMRLDRCRMRFPVVVAGPHRPGSGTQPGSPHSFHENRPPDAPRLLPDALPRGCLLDPALALAPSQVHPTARSLNSRRARTQQQNARLQLLGNASETKTGRHPSPLLSGKRSGHLMVRHPVEPQMSQKNSDFSPCATYPQICQGPVEKSKVITQHSTPLTPLYPQIYLAVLFSPCDILNL